jgi:hypothetical protein
MQSHSWFAAMFTLAPCPCQALPMHTELDDSEHAQLTSHSRVKWACNGVTKKQVIVIGGFLFAVIIIIAIATATKGSTSLPSDPLQRAIALQTRYPLIDGHNDLPWSVLLLLFLTEAVCLLTLLLTTGSTAKNLTTPSGPSTWNFHSRSSTLTSCESNSVIWARSSGAHSRRSFAAFRSRTCSHTQLAGVCTLAANSKTRTQSAPQWSKSTLCTR